MCLLSLYELVDLLFTFKATQERTKKEEKEKKGKE